MYRMTALVGVALCLGLLPMAAPALGAGDYIVVVKDGFSPTRAARRHGAVPTHIYPYALRGYAATLSDAAVARAQADYRVTFVAEDREFSLPEPSPEPLSVNTVASEQTQQVPTGVQRIGGTQSTTAKIDGVDQRVDADIAILDTGVQDDHPDLNVAGGFNCVKDNTHFRDHNGHGTLVAGVAAALDNAFGVVGVAPGARIWGIKVLNDKGFGAASSIVCGIDWVTARAGLIDVAKMSLNAPIADDGNCGRTNGDPVHLAICNSVAAGVTYAVAAGNNSADAADFALANFDEVIAVSALADCDGKSGGLSDCSTALVGSGCITDCGCLSQTRDDTFACFSNFGPDVDIAAPGVFITSTFPGASYATESGTSFASPHVAGAAALYKANHPSASPAEVKAALIKNWERGPIAGDPDSFPEGLVNVRKF